MAKFYVGKGIDEYVAQLGILDAETDNTVGKAIYKGAAIVADAVRSELQSVPLTTGFDEKQKEGLLKSLGIAPKKVDGSYVNVKIGFDGYNDKKTRSFPNGQPNAMIARAVDSGTSFSRKNAFMSRAVRKTKDKAEEEMKIVIDQSIRAIMKEEVI